MITVSFNGPEREAEFTAVMPKITKKFMHNLQENAPSKFADKYQNVCLQQNLQKAADQASLEALALFSL